jgi:hypothetical protein
MAGLKHELHLRDPQILYRQELPAFALDGLTRWLNVIGVPPESL